jgi:hypothetical protein
LGKPLRDVKENVFMIPARNRLDHILPRSYLEGFTNPSSQGQLSVFDRRGRCWFEASPTTAGAEKGFYDYSPGSTPDITADAAFSALESRFPVVRKELIASSFAAWGTHREFLLEYAQMLRARSRLFRAQAMGYARQSIIGVVEEVVEEENPTGPGTIRTGLKVKPYAPQDEARHEQRLRNITITQMCMEIAKGAGLFSGLHWCLRVTEGSNHPVITADEPVIALGSAPEAPVLREDVLMHPDTWLVFPVCREACLIGNIGNSFKIEPETAPFQPSGLAWLQGRYFNADSGFVYSPSRIALQEF